MTDLAGPAVVDGIADGAVEFREEQTGTTIKVNPDHSTGKFRLRLTEGVYKVSCGSVIRNLVLLPASSVSLDFRPAVAVGVELHATNNNATSTVTIEAKISGQGIHRLHLLADNLMVTEAEKELNLKLGNTVTWNAKINNPSIPWVAVIVVDGKIAERHELLGY